MPDDKEKDGKSGCRIAEILQWSCSPEKGESVEKAGAIHCYPIPRIFRL